MSNSELAILTPETAKRTAGDLATACLEITVASAESTLQAKTALLELATMKKEIGLVFDGPIQAAHNAHKGILAAKKGVLDPVEKAESYLKRAIGSWEMQVREREAEARRLEEKRLREEAEARRLETALAMEEKHGPEIAQEFLDRPLVVSRDPTPRDSEAPRVSGVSIGESWKFEILDPSQVPAEFLMVDESKVRRFVSAMKKDAKIPGVRIWAEATVRATAGK